MPRPVTPQGEANRGLADEPAAGVHDRDCRSPEPFVNTYTVTGTFPTTASPDDSRLVYGIERVERGDARGALRWFEPASREP